MYIYRVIQLIHVDILYIWFFCITKWALKMITYWNHENSCKTCLHFSKGLWAPLRFGLLCPSLRPAGHRQDVASSSWGLHCQLHAVGGAGTPVAAAWPQRQRGWPPGLPGKLIDHGWPIWAFGATFFDVFKLWRDAFGAVFFGEDPWFYHVLS